MSHRGREHNVAAPEAAFLLRELAFEEKLRLLMYCVMSLLHRVMSWIGQWTGSSPTWMTWSPWMCLKVVAQPQRAREAETLLLGLVSETDQAVSFTEKHKSAGGH